MWRSAFGTVSTADGGRQASGRTCCCQHYYTLTPLLGAIEEKHNLALIVFALSLPFPVMGIRRCRVFMKFIYHAASEIRALRRQALSNQPSTQKNTSISARNRLASPPTQQLCCNGNSLSDPFCVIPFGAIKFRHLYFAKFATAPRDETAPQSPSQWE